MEAIASIGSIEMRGEAAVTPVEKGGEGADHGGGGELESEFSL